MTPSPSGLRDNFKLGKNCLCQHDANALCLNQLKKSQWLFMACREMEQLSQSLLALYRASHAEPITGFQEKAIGLVQSVLAFDSCTWSTSQITPEGMVYYTAFLYRELPDRLDAYEEVKTKDAVVFDAVLHLGETRNYHARSLYQGREYACIRDYAHRFHHENLLVTASPEPDSSLTHALGFYRSDPDQQFSSREQQLCQQLVPHLQEALTINRMSYVQNLKGEDPIRQLGMALVDAKGVVHYQENGFGTAIRLEWPAWKGGVLPPPLYHALLEEKHPTYRGEAIVAAYRPLSDLWLLRVRARMTVDKLSVRELAVARHVADGFSYKEIARLLGIAPDTVRNHIRAIQTKLGVRNNAELAAQFKQAGY